MSNYLTTKLQNKFSKNWKNLKEIDKFTITIRDFNTLNRRLKKIRKYFEVNENINTRYQNLWDAVKAVLREKFIAVIFYISKKVLNQLSNLTP